MSYYFICLSEFVFFIGLSEFVISLKEKGSNFFMASGLLMAQKLSFKRLLTPMAFFS
jgi:hypothetical protein